MCRAPGPSPQLSGLGRAMRHEAVMSSRQRDPPDYYSAGLFFRFSATISNWPANGLNGIAR